MHYYGVHLVPGLSFENNKHNDHKCHTLYGEENLVILMLARIITYIIILIMVCNIEAIFIYLLSIYGVYALQVIIYSGLNVFLELHIV